MPLRERQSLVAGVHARHFWRAAEWVFVTQPALSLVIMTLEEESGATILRSAPEPHFTD